MSQKDTSAIEERILNEKEKILEYLTESGNISFACKKTGIVRKTFYRWKEGDRVFSERADSAISSGQTFVNDLAHTQLIRRIQEGDMQAIRFHLVSCHPDYRPKLPERAEKVIPISAIEIIPINYTCKKCGKETKEDESDHESSQQSASNHN